MDESKSHNVTMRDVPGLELALRYSRKYEDQQWLSFLIKVAKRNDEARKPRLRIISEYQHETGSIFYTAIYSENDWALAIQFLAAKDWQESRTSFLAAAEHALYLADQHLTQCSKAEIFYCN